MVPVVLASQRPMGCAPIGKPLGVRCPGLLAALVRAVFVVVPDELVEYHDGMLLAVDQPSVGALRSHGAHKPLGVAVCSRSSGGGLHRVDALGGEHRIERCGVFGVSVADEEAELGDPFVEFHQQIAGDLRGPGPGGMRGHAEDVDAPCADLHDEQDVEPA